MREIVTDVLVVGGGTSGVTAALAAADGGARVLLVESGGGVGGVGTHSGIHEYYKGLHVGLQPDFDQQTRQLAGELGSGAAGFHPEAKKIVLQKLLTDKGVTILYHCMTVNVMKEQRRVTGLILESPEESICVMANVTLDCTSNGDIAALAGAAFSGGREWDGIMQEYSVPPRLLDMKVNTLTIHNIDAGWVDSGSVRDVSRAFLEGRKLLWNLQDKQQLLFIANTSNLGAREGRHICGEYRLGMEDLILDTRFDDVVMKCYSHYDNHARDMANESRFAQVWTAVMGAWGHMIGGDVPYRTFLPVELDGLIIACRAISMDHDTSSVCRMQPDMHAIGEVAGTAAALCCSLGGEPRDLDINMLQRRLIERGVIKETDLTRPSAPWVMADSEISEFGCLTSETVRQPQVIVKLIGKLGTEEEGSALWWLWKAGIAALPVLREELAGAKGLQRRGIAIALALLGDRTGLPFLLQSVIDQDDDAHPGVVERVPPRWIASLLALKGLKDLCCVNILLQQLPPEKPTERLPTFAQILYSLHYFIDVAALLPVHTTREVVQKVKELLSTPNLGDDWNARSNTGVSIKWNIDLTSAYLLALLEDPEGDLILEAYLQDHRVFVQNMAKTLKSRLQSARHVKREGGRV
jgi:hypothetical protein